MLVSLQFSGILQLKESQLTSMYCKCLFIDNFYVPSIYGPSLTVRLYRDAKAHCSAKNLAEQIANLGALRSVKCNANGSQVSILISQVTTYNSLLFMCF